MSPSAPSSAQTLQHRRAKYKPGDPPQDEDRPGLDVERMVIWGLFLIVVFVVVIAAVT